MRASIKASALFGAIGVFTCFGVAFAQTTASTGAAVSVSSEQDANLTPQQMLERARSFKPSMDSNASVVQRQVSDAKLKHDVVKSLCLSDKLSQIHVAVNTASGRIDTLSAAVSHNDADRAKHEFTIIQVLRDRAQALVAEANQCIGEETGFIGESTVTVTIDPNIPNTDTTEFPNDPIVSEPPVLSSPTK